MIKVGSKVQCRYYNSMDKRFFGSLFEAEVIEIQTDNCQNYYPVRNFVVKRSDDGRIVTIWRKEVKKVLKGE